MKPKVLAILVIVIVVAFGIGLALSDNKAGEGPMAEEGRLAGEVALSLPGEQKTVQPDRTPPDFFIIGNASEPVALSELQGKYVFINFWNTWCPPCREEMPDLNKLYLDYRQKNVEFLFVNIAAQEKSIDDITSFLTKNNYSMPVYLDRTGEVARVYSITAIPTTVVIDPDGEVIYARAGQINYELAKSLLEGE